MEICCMFLCEFRESWSQPYTDGLWRAMMVIKPPHDSLETSYIVVVQLVSL